MIDLPVGDDGFLRMEQFSDADIDGAELGDEHWFTDPEPLGAAAWIRVIAGAVSAAESRPELDELVPPVPLEPGSDDPRPPDDDLGTPGDGALDDVGAHDDAWAGPEPGGHDGGAYEAGVPDSHGTSDG
jgi:hypothetical protein